MRHSLEEKLDVVREILSGKGLLPLCRERHMDKNNVRMWVSRYKAYGEDGLRKRSGKSRLTQAEKERIVWEHVKEGVTLHSLSLRYDVDRASIKLWVRKMRSGGILYETKRVTRPKKDHMARPKKKEPQTELERLQAENLRLRAENALLKKVKTLVEEKKARALQNGQKSSRN